MKKFYELTYRHYVCSLVDVSDTVFHYLSPLICEFSLPTAVLTTQIRYDSVSVDINAKFDICSQLPSHDSLPIRASSRRVELMTLSARRRLIHRLIITENVSIRGYHPRASRCQFVAQLKFVYHV